MYGLKRLAAVKGSYEESLGEQKYAILYTNFPMANGGHHLADIVE
jgi:hypothetical protein